MNHYHSDLFVEKYLIGELSSEQQTAFEAALSNDEQLQAKVELFKLQNTVFLAKNPAPWFLQKVAREQLAVKNIKKKFNYSNLLIGAGSLAMLLLFFYMPSMSVFFPESETIKADEVYSAETRLKGEEQRLLVYRRTGLGSELIPNDAVARAGDLLQLQFVLADSAWVGVFSLDGNGVVTMHLDEQNHAVWRSSGSHLIPRSYELDDAPYYEKFYLITSKEVFNISEVAGKILDDSYLVKEFSDVFKMEQIVLRKDSK
jgi:hypothetical protein